MHNNNFNNLLSESLGFKDLEGMMKPTVHVDEFSSKMGDDDDVIVLSFFVPWMPLVALIFASMWAWGMIAGGTIDLARKAMTNANFSTEGASVTIDITDTATESKN